MLSSGRPWRAGNRTKIAHDAQRAKSATAPLTSNPDFKNPEFLYAKESKDQRTLPRPASVGDFGMKLFHQVSDVSGKVPDRFDTFGILPYLAGQPAEDHVPVC